MNGNRRTFELVLELGVEEIPASVVGDAACQLSAILMESLRSQRLSASEPELLYTPRRIIIYVRDLPDRQDDLIESIIGPPKNIGYDASGQLTKAGLAFINKNSVPVPQLKIVETPKGEYLCIERRVRGERTYKLLQSLLPSAIARIQFAKTMQWSSDKFRFVRPIRWIVALFGGRCIRFKVADVVSSRFTRGHRFLGSRKIRVNSFDSLKAVLYANSVIPDPRERQNRIIKELKEWAEHLRGHLLEDPDLLKTVVNLNEMPHVICGSFEERFLSLPSEILITVMKEHQKYFCITNSRGQLLPAFLAVVNVPSDAKGIIRAGHERVLRARLADAAFFWETDRKTLLKDRMESLKNVMFQEKLGSYYDKTMRMSKLLPQVVQAVGKTRLFPDLECAVGLSKCDLVTEMVKEFPDLQGVVGGLYARAEGYPETVWKAIYEQYRPKSSVSPSPSTETGAILALIDRMDTVCGCFSIGLTPSGSGDPFAIRRQGNGILKIIFDHRLGLSLSDLVQWSLQTHGQSSDKVSLELRDFFEGRLRFLFEEMGYSYDCVNAVLAAGFDVPLDALERLRAIESMRQSSEFIALASNFKRVVNIVSQCGEETREVQESLLTEGAEQALWHEYLNILPKVEAARRERDYTAVLLTLSSMRQAVDEFFKQVLVMCQDLVVRSNRIALLTRLSRLFGGIADISKIVVEKAV